VSSNSSTTSTKQRRETPPSRTMFNRGPVADLLDEALGKVKAHVPACYEAARVSLVGKIARCRIDDEQFDARVTRGTIVLEQSSKAIDIFVDVSKQTIRALIRNDQSLSASILSGSLRVRGKIADASALGRAMTAFLHGAVRSPALPAILARFEVLAQPRRE
jgi:hypothetical protein